MSWYYGVRHRLRTLVGRGRADRETREEMAHHIECAVRAHMEAGCTSEEAERLARAELGSADAWREATADVRTGSHLETLRRDMRIAARSLLRQPFYTGTVVLTLGLAIGANTAVFSVIRGVFLNPVPAFEPDRVVALYDAWNATDLYRNLSLPDLNDLAARTRTLSSVGGSASAEASLDAGSGPEHVRIELVTGAYFETLGLRAERGRLIEGSEAAAGGGSAVIVLAHDYWRRRLHAARDIVGRTVHVAGVPFTVIGVAPRGFVGTDLTVTTDAWVPITMNAQLPLGIILGRESSLRSRIMPLVAGVARLHDGVTIDQARDELHRLLLRIREEFPRSRPPDARQPVTHAVTVAPIEEAVSKNDRDNLLRFVRIVLSAVVLILILACANVAHLLVVRASERAHEFGIRTVLGAGRARIAQQLFVESVMMAALAGMCALVIAIATTRLIAAFTLPGGIALDRVDIALDRGVLGFTAALALLTALLFGLLPALRVAGSTAIAALRDGGERITNHSPRSALVALQVAISLLLLIAALLFLRSVQEGLRADLGFDPAPIAAIDVEPRLAGYDDDRAVLSYDRLVEAAAALPGAVSAAAAQHVPLQPYRPVEFTAGPTTSDGGVAASHRIQAGLASISADYFETLGIRVVAGRTFLPTDALSPVTVAIVNESAARVLWPGESPLGRTISLFRMFDFIIVGVVADTRYAGLDDTAPFVFAPLAQEPIGRASILVRTHTPAATLAALRALARRVEPAVPVTHARLVQDQVDDVLTSQRFGATLLSLLGLVALCIAVVGLYGTVAYNASRRAREIGIRVALGATPRAVVWLLLRTTSAAVATGIIAGILLSLISGDLLRHFLYGITPLDPAAFLAACAILAAGATAMALLPALRAARADPLRSIRE